MPPMDNRARVWLYRTTAIHAADEAEARLMLTREAARAIPEDQASIEIMSIRRTPTGRWSAMIRRVRVEPQGEWCLHCGSDTCEHALAHNAGYGRAAR